jgi:hypothetical protein
MLHVDDVQHRRRTVKSFTLRKIGLTRCLRRLFRVQQFRNMRAGSSRWLIVTRFPDAPSGEVFIEMFAALQCHRFAAPCPVYAFRTRLWKVSH